MRRVLRELHRIRYRLLLVNALIVAVPLAGVGFARFYEHEMLRALEGDMIHQAQLVREVALAADGHHLGDMATFLRRAKRYTMTRIRLLGSDGTLAADTDAAVHGRDATLAARQEVRKALAGRYGSATRYWESSGDVYLYSALPIDRDGEVLGVVYVTRSTRPVHAAMHRLRRSLALLAKIAFGFTAVLTLFFAATISRPLRRLEGIASRVAGGERRSPSIARALARLCRRRDEIGAVSRAVDAMESELDERARSVADLAANISHELKSPLTSIRGAAELLRDGAVTDGAARDRFLDHMIEDAERLDRLVSRLLELTRVPADDAPFEDVDVRELCRRLVRAAQASSEVRFVDRAPASAVVAGRRGQLESAIRNLVDNAQAHAAPASAVSVTLSTDDRRLRVAVHNHGRPIPPRHIARIWQRFFTTRGGCGGTGLGLPIVAAVAAAHGGSVAVESADGHGTTFEVILPMHD